MLVKTYDETTKQCLNYTDNPNADREYFLARGFVSMEVEQGYDGNYYLFGKAPTKPLEMLNAERIAEIDARLLYLDGKGIRPNEAINLAKALDTAPNSQDVEILQQIVAEKAKLRAERATLAPVQTFSL